MSYYPGLDSHIRHKVKVILDLSNYATKRNPTEADTSDLTVKKDSIALKAEVNKLDNNKMVNVPNVGKWKFLSVHLKNLSDVGDNEVVKNTKFNTLKTKINNLENNFSDATTLNYINQCNTDIKSLKKTIGNLDKRIPDTRGLVTTTVLNTKIDNFENKIPDTSRLVTGTVLNR